MQIVLACMLSFMLFGGYNNLYCEIPVIDRVKEVELDLVGILNDSLHYYEKETKETTYEGFRKILMLFYNIMNQRDGDTGELKAQLVKHYEYGNYHAAYILAIVCMGPAFNINDFVEARKYLEVSVENGVEKARTMLALYHLGNIGGEGNYGYAVSLLEDSASSGDPVAQGTLGYLYLTGESVPESEDNAFEMLKKAHEAGLNSSSMVYAELLLRRGGNKEEASAILETQINRGNSGAMYELGTYLVNGYFFDKDIDTGLRYLTQAAKMKNLPACYELVKQFTTLQSSDTEVQRKYLTNAFIWSVYANKLVSRQYMLGKREKHEVPMEPYYVMLESKLTKEEKALALNVVGNLLENN